MNTSPIKSNCYLPLEPCLSHTEVPCHEYAERLFNEGADYDAPAQEIEESRALLIELLPYKFPDQQIDANEILFLGAKRVVFTDGSLGCPKPGEFYIKALILGVSLLFSYQGELFHVHNHKKVPEINI